MTQDEIFAATLESFIQIDLERALAQATPSSCWLILYEDGFYQYGDPRHFEQHQDINEAFIMMHLPPADHENPAQFLRDQINEDHLSELNAYYSASRGV